MGRRLIPGGRVRGASAYLTWPARPGSPESEDTLSKIRESQERLDQAAQKLFHTITTPADAAAGIDRFVGRPDRPTLEQLRHELAPPNEDVTRIVDAVKAALPPTPPAAPPAAAVDLSAVTESHRKARQPCRRPLDHGGPDRADRGPAAAAGWSLSRRTSPPRGQGRSVGADAVATA